MEALGCLPLGDVADLHSKAQALCDGAGGSAAVHADAVRVHKGIHFTGMKHLWRIIGVCV